MSVHVVVLDDRNCGVVTLGVFSDRDAAVACGREATEEDLDRWGYTWGQVEHFDGGWSWGEANAIHISEHELPVVQCERCDDGVLLK